MCLNVCPVYRHVSGHAYDVVYSGPMGKVLTPLLSGFTEGDGSSVRVPSLCHACSDACPVEIPLADLIIELRSDVPAPQSTGRRTRRIACGPRGCLPGRHRGGYRLSTAVARVTRGRIPAPGLGRWTDTRTMPKPARRFHARWAKERG